MRQDWIWDGGRVCVDLVNTLRDRWGRPWELLVEPADLTEWLGLAGLLDPPVAASADQLDTARRLREAVDRAARARSAGAALDPADVDLINEVARKHRSPPAQLRLDPQGRAHRHLPPPEQPVDHALGAVAADAVELLTTEPVPVLRVCALDTCGLRFVDSSPAHNRQWCSMRRCGNRAKARQHYARRRSANS